MNVTKYGDYFDDYKYLYLLVFCDIGYKILAPLQIDDFLHFLPVFLTHYLQIQ